LHGENNPAERYGRIITISSISGDAVSSREAKSYAMIAVTIRDRSDITIVEMSSLLAYRIFASAEIAVDYLVINHVGERAFLRFARVQ